MNNSFKIMNRKIGLKFKPLIIVELGINHNGVLKKAKKLVDEAYKAGAEIIKHQTHICEDEMSREAKKIIPSHTKQNIYDIISNSFPLKKWSSDEYNDFVKNYKSCSYDCKKLNINEKIYGSITFLNVPNNKLYSVFNKVYRDVVFVATYRLRDKFWRLINVKECLPFKFLEISRRELNVSDHEMIVAVVKKSNIFEEIYEILQHNKIF